MKKRKKFLLAFVISWCVVMSVFLVRSVMFTKYYTFATDELSSQESRLYVITNQVECIENIVLLTIILYSTATIEFENMKKYWLDNIKVLLAVFVFLILTISINLLLNEGNIDFGILLSAGLLTVLAYGPFLILNIIVNLIKDCKKKANNNK